MLWQHSYWYSTSLGALGREGAVTGYANHGRCLAAVADSDCREVKLQFEALVETVFMTFDGRCVEG